jgi:hypothetical protein
MANSRRNRSDDRSTSRRSGQSGSNRDSQRGSGDGRGWHGDPEGHARAARGEETKGNDSE